MNYNAANSREKKLLKLHKGKKKQTYDRVLTTNRIDS